MHFSTSASISEPENLQSGYPASDRAFSALRVFGWLVIGFALTLDDDLAALHAHQKIDHLAPQAHLRLVG